MNLKVLGSSSSGNCYILDNGKEALLIEAGLSIKEISKALKFDFERVVGCLVSHRHGDHTRSLGNLDGLVDIYCNEDVAISKKLKHYTEIKPFSILDIGGFEVISFEVIHDVPCLGFFIKHEDMGKLAFITDSAYADYTFKGVNHLLVECNYTNCELAESIKNGTTPEFQRNRLIQTHMELGETINVIHSNKTDDLVNVVLLHLSARNSDEEFMVEQIKLNLGLNAIVAKPGLELSLTKTLY